MTASPDDVDRLLAQLTAFPLIDSADLDRAGAAYQAFELVLCAIHRAALLQAANRQEQQAVGEPELFQRFVRDCFPEGRGRWNNHYAGKLWKLRCAFVKQAKTGKFQLIHNHPEQHWRTLGRLRTLDLQSLIDDFRHAVGNLEGMIRTDASLLEAARAELGERTVRPIVVERSDVYPTITASATSAPVELRVPGQSVQDEQPRPPTMAASIKSKPAGRRKS
jgi:hypothetical protein